MAGFRVHQYEVVGRALPTPSAEHLKIFRMKLWATNEVRAKSKFWYFLRKLKKVKKSNGQVLAINEGLSGSGSLFLAYSISMSFPAVDVFSFWLLCTSGYTLKEKLKIATTHLIPRVLDQHGLSSDFLQIPEFGGSIKNQYYSQAQYDEVRSEWSNFVYSFV